MKSTLFRKVLKEELIEVNKSVAETINCLCEQLCGEEHKVADNYLSIYFSGLKNGKISVRSSFGRYRDFRFGSLQAYYVYANVISQDNKTYVKITSVYNKLDIWLRIIIIVLFTPLVVILKLISDGLLFIPAIILCGVVFVIFMIEAIEVTLIRKNHGLKILKLMENAVKKRVQNIERWDK